MRKKSTTVTGIGVVYSNNLAFNLNSINALKNANQISLFNQIIFFRYSSNIYLHKTYQDRV